MAPPGVQYSDLQHRRPPAQSRLSLRGTGGLAPVSGLRPQPVPTDIKPRILATAINENDNTASFALALDVAGYFDLDAGKAREIAAQVGKVVSNWRDEAARHGLAKSEIDRMASAFEHEDLRLASGR